MSNASDDTMKDSWIYELKRAVPDPWRTSLLVMLTFLTLAFCSTLRFPANPPSGHYFVSFAPLSWPEASPPQPSADSMARVSVTLATTHLTWPCLSRPCGLVVARGTFSLLPVSSSAEIDPALAALRRASLPSKNPAIGYVDRDADSTMTFVLSPGTADSLTIRLRYQRKAQPPYYVGTACRAACSEDLPIRAFAFEIIK
jgi:hypothetical protein